MTFVQVVSTASRLCLSRVSIVSNIAFLSLSTCAIIFLTLASFFSALCHDVSGKDDWCDEMNHGLFQHMYGLRVDFLLHALLLSLQLLGPGPQLRYIRVPEVVWGARLPEFTAC